MRGGGELLLLLLLLLLFPLSGLLGLRLLDIFLGILLGLGELEYEDDLPRLPAGPRPLRGEMDLERERPGLRIGDRLRLRIGDLLRGLRTLLGGDLRLRGGGDRLRTGLPRILLGDPLGGDLYRLGGGGEDGERPLDGDAGLRLGGVSPRRRLGEPGLRRGGESGNLLGDAPLLGRGDRLLGESTVFRCGEVSLGRLGPSFSMSALSDFEASLFGALETGLGGGDTFRRGGSVNFALTTFPSIWPPSINSCAFSASALALNST